ncbi:MAG: hypothetical protein II838_13965 [Lachnospiraceae bacterium]|jgi:hypothetical protein|nr:hypothetical protein [Lachnospiraceae bacterium]MBQ3784523.1 hypothetical protein [Lachnospiraceae bacterium]
MLCKKWLPKITSGLLALSAVFATSMGCHAIWGEIEVPECLHYEMKK